MFFIFLNLSFGADYNLILDEIKILNIALNDSQVKDLYEDNLNFIEHRSKIIDFDKNSKNLDFEVFFPFIEKNHNFICHIYYDKK